VRGDGNKHLHAVRPTTSLKPGTANVRVVRSKGLHERQRQVGWLVDSGQGNIVEIICHGIPLPTSRLASMQALQSPVTADGRATQSVPHELKFILNRIYHVDKAINAERICSHRGKGGTEWSRGGLELLFVLGPRTTPPGGTELRLLSAKCSERWGAGATENVTTIVKTTR